MQDAFINNENIVFVDNPCFRFKDEPFFAVYEEFKRQLRTPIAIVFDDETKEIMFVIKELTKEDKDSFIQEEIKKKKDEGSQ